MTDIEVRTGSGRLRGRQADGVAVFRGIPFAAAPFGELRFRAPQPPAAWDGVRQATESGPGCPQPAAPEDPFDRYFNPATTGPDCLTLDVWTPDPGGSGLPVMVWIHGGAYLTGTGSAPAHDGTSFARDGIVHVGINYRLGLEGFIHLEGEPANLGLRDQVAALQWVQENIAAFGGDPGAVTIFGQSAGGVSVMNLLAMPPARGLFRRAVAQSGSTMVTVAPEQALVQTRRLAELFGVEPTAAGFAAVDPERAAAAAMTFALGFVDPSTSGDEAFGISPFRAVLDPDTLPEPVSAAVAAGASRDVDLMAGSTHDETTGFLQLLGQLEQVDEGWAAAALHAFGRTDDDLETYRKASRPDAGRTELIQAAWTDWAFRMPTLRLLEAHRGRCFGYEFTWASPALPPGFGSNHALEVPFVRDDLATFRGIGPAGEMVLGPDAPQQLATAMHRAWAEFAKTGDPGWAQYEAPTRTTMRFDATSEAVDDLAGPERELWVTTP
jgi:para-nitrobenzyl esterase